MHKTININLSHYFDRYLIKNSAFWRADLEGLPPGRFIQGEILLFVNMVWFP